MGIYRVCGCRSRLRLAAELRDSTTDWLGGIFSALWRSSGFTECSSQAVRARAPREIGVRVALGAGPLKWSHYVLRQTAKVVAISVLLGLAMSAVLSESLQALLFRVGPLDLVAFAGAALVLLGAAAVASYVPAKRAATMNPVTALRHD